MTEILDVTVHAYRLFDEWVCVVQGRVSFDGETADWIELGTWQGKPLKSGDPRWDAGMILDRAVALLTRNGRLPQSDTPTVPGGNP